MLPPLLCLCASSLLSPGVATATGVGLRNSLLVTAPPLVMERRDDDFIYDAKEEWWAYLLGIIAICAGLIVLVYLAYTYDFSKWWYERQERRHELRQQQHFSHRRASPALFTISKGATTPAAYEQPQLTAVPSPINNMRAYL